jgi:uncharacterized protein DUF6894
MPRYYFDFHDDVEVSLDQEGTDLADMQAARDEATETLLSLAKDALPPSGKARELSIRVRDAQGKHLLAISLGYSEEPPDWVR